MLQSSAALQSRGVWGFKWSDPSVTCTGFSLHYHVTVTVSCLITVTHTHTHTILTYSGLRMYTCWSAQIKKKKRKETWKKCTHRNLFLHVQTYTQTHMHTWHIFLVLPSKFCWSSHSNSWLFWPARLTFSQMIYIPYTVHSPQDWNLTRYDTISRF